MEALANRPYWSRLWIVQELLLGQEVILLSERKAMKWCNLYDSFVAAMFHPQHGRVEKLMVEDIGLTVFDLPLQPRAMEAQVPTAASLILARGRAGQEVRRRPLHKLLL